MTLIMVQLVVKSQILAGGRGLGTFQNGFKGGVHIVKADQVEDIAGTENYLYRKIKLYYIPQNTFMYECCSRVFHLSLQNMIFKVIHVYLTVCPRTVKMCSR